MPKDIHFAHLFQFFNTLSFSLIIGLPMVLFFQHLHASATVLGIIYSLPALMNILQIPGAAVVEKVGYRSFVLRGWTLRGFVLVGMIAVPLLAGVLGLGTQIGLMLGLLFIYNCLRGFAACGFLPWMTHLVPEAVRGTFVSRDQACGALGGFLTLLGSAALFHFIDGANSFAAAFGISFATAMVSLFFLRRIPDVPVPHEAENPEKIPWRSMFLYPPFLKLLFYNVVINFVMAPAGVFWVPLVRQLAGWDDSRIMVFGALLTVLSVGTIWGFGRIVDRVGSRPLLAFSGISLIGQSALWLCFACGLLPMNTGVMAALLILGACAIPVFSMANALLLMGTVPIAGRSHFFALHSVVNSVVLGVSPTLFGIALDGLKDLHWKVGGGELDRYGAFYLSMILVVAIALYLLHRLDEPRAMTTKAFLYELLVVTPSRALTLVGLRRPFP